MQGDAILSLSNHGLDDIYVDAHGILPAVLFWSSNDSPPSIPTLWENFLYSARECMLQYHHILFLMTKKVVSLAYMQIYVTFDDIYQEWWTHLWLNEGVASFIEYLCVDHCFPELDIWTQFVNQDLARALQLDALKNSHAIEVSVYIYTLLTR